MRAYICVGVPLYAHDPIWTDVYSTYFHKLLDRGYCRIGGEEFWTSPPSESGEQWAGIVVTAAQDGFTTHISTFELLAAVARVLNAFSKARILLPLTYTPAVFVLTSDLHEDE